MVLLSVLQCVSVLALAVSGAVARSPIQCPSGQVVNPLGECQVIATCASTTCLAPSGCIETPTGGKCVPLCKEGTVRNPLGECESIATCASILCKVGTKCVESPRGAECVPQKCEKGSIRNGLGECQPIATCASTTCLAPSDCIETPTGAKCVAPCKEGTVRDAKGTCIPDKCPNGAKIDPVSGKCVCPEIVCVRAPCINPCKCALLNCPPGTSCTEEGKCQAETCGTKVCLDSVGCEETPQGPKCIASEGCPMGSIKNSIGECEPISTCASTSCVLPRTCVQTPTGTTCAPPCGKGRTRNEKGNCVPTSTCANVKCTSGSTCEETSSGPECVPTITCANVRCASGTKCEETSSGPKCVPTLTCANALCTPGNTCEESDSGPKCVPNKCDDIICTAIYDPVCANKKTYSSDCIPTCLGLDFTKGPCKKTCACPKILRPVCGSNGTTYSNKCLAECAGINKTSPGKCSPGKGCQQKCSKKRRTVCSRFGNQYRNKCVAKCAGVRRASRFYC